MMARTVAEVLFRDWNPAPPEGWHVRLVVEPSPMLEDMSGPRLRLTAIRGEGVRAEYRHAARPMPDPLKFGCNRGGLVDATMAELRAMWRDVFPPLPKFRIRTKPHARRLKP